MKCLFCGKEIADNSVFCTNCGKKQEKQKEEKKEVLIFCTKCGTKLKEGALFCTGCGTSVTELKKGNTTKENTIKESKAKEKVQLQKEEEKGKEKQAEKKEFVQKSRTAPQKTVEVSQAQTQELERREVSEVQTEDLSDSVYITENQKTGSLGKTIAIVVGIVLVVAILAVAAIFGVNKLLFPEESVNTENVDREDNDSGKREKEDEAAEASDTTEVNVSEENAEEPAYDFDLTKEDTISLTGYVRNAASGNRILQWSEAISVYGGDETLLKDVKSVRIDETALPEGMLDVVEKDEEIVLTGKAYIEGDKLYIEATKASNSKGKDLEKVYKKYLSKQEDYVIPNSDSVRLSEEDIEDLTLQELNYAKNEIYARHGRKFDSKELRDYFNSKSWYNGTIDPADFTDSMLSKVELDNVKLIKNKEFSINPNGYQLDQ